VALIVAYVSDLMLASRVAEPLRSAGHEVVLTKFPARADEADVLICDLDEVDAIEVADLARPTLGFYSHIDVETGRAAREAGLEIVVPRSRMAREILELVDRLSGE
jgi:hypothetical protein